MQKLNHELLSLVKKGFVPMPGGAEPPAAGAGMLTQAQAAPMGGGAMPPMDPAAMGGAMPPMDPAAMGGGAMPPMDPAAMGGAMPPMDPAAMGGAMPPMDPAALAGGELGGELPPEEGQITMSATEFKDILQTIIAGVTGAKVKETPKAAAGDGAPGGEDKLDTIIKLLGGSAGAPPPPM